MPRGRPTGSTIRNNIVEILFYKNKAYGYQIHKIYNEIFPQVTRESIYYNLKKGLKTEEFAIDEVKQEKGEYSLCFNLHSLPKPGIYLIILEGKRERIIKKWVSY